MYPLVEDLLGIEVHIGDTVAYAVREGNIAAMRTGVVTDIREQTDDLYHDTKVWIHVDSVTDSSYMNRNNGKARFNALLKRFVVVHVPNIEVLGE